MSAFPIRGLLGTQLLYRTTRKLTLTEAGQALKQGAMNVKASTQEAIDTISGYSEQISGHIKMSMNYLALGKLNRLIIDENS